MKPTRMIAVLFMASCLFASCHHDDGPSKEVVQKMKETALEWAAYLSDNYQMGDSIYFLRTDLETHETQVEGFVVETSEFFERGYEEEDDLLGYRDEENATFSYVVEGYSDVVVLKNASSYLHVDLEVNYDGETETINEYCHLNINYNTCIEINHMTIDKDYITITSCSDSCTMQRNVGIIQFGNDQYSWELMEKN